ncbi:MAG TPA: hypothetical protein VJX10_17745, partial [Pseudonocardiaceae bacterium]|nr:hypothetical protein [Pseudonocardiaceae bacterium]
DLTALRRRTRRDSHAYWLPLLLFGVLVLAGSLLYRGRFGDQGGVPPYPLQLFTGGLLLGGNATAIGIYWLAVAVVGALATLAWYRWRGDRTGLRVRTLPYLLYLAAALLVMLGVVPLATAWSLLLLAGGPLALWVSAGVFVLGLVIAAIGRKVTWIVAVGAVIAVLAAGNVAAAAPLHGFGGLLVIGIGLLGLAWAERSVGCAVVAVLFTAAALLANLYDMENIFYQVFGFTDDLTVIAFYSLVVPALVLLVGGVVALLGGRREATG